MIRNWDEKDEAEATQSVWSELSLGGGPARHRMRDSPRQLCPGLGTRLGAESGGGRSRRLGTCLCAERSGRGEQALGDPPLCREVGAGGTGAWGPSSVQRGRGWGK